MSTKSNFSDQSASLYPSASAAVIGVVDDVANSGERVSPTAGSAEKASSSFIEKLGFGFVLADPLDRMYRTTARQLDLSVAVARFVWMMSGSNRLADIAFYEPKVRGFTDDGYSVPGSSYGQRIFQSSPGIDQLKAIIDRIKADPNTRRATVSIYQPTDATRESKDIPCTFGLMYHPRNGALNATTIMRSNNAIGLLQFNIFEFSLLAEVVAAEAGLPMGQLLHFAGSMHAFENALEGWNNTGKQKPISSPMSPMPREVSALDQIAKLIIFEAEMRHQSANLHGAKGRTWIDRVQKEFDPYWQQFAFLLLLAVAKQNSDPVYWEELRSLLRSEFIPFYPDEKRPEASKPEAEGGGATGDLFGFEKVPQITLPEGRGTSGKILDFALAHEKRTGEALSLSEFSAIQGELESKLAARSRNKSTISESDFDEALKKIRTKRPTGK